MVRASATFLARPGWYDRNPVRLFQYYKGDGVAPHSSTLRWTYTVPAGKKAWVELLVNRVKRSGAATTPDAVLSQIYLTPYGGSISTLLYVFFNSNTLGAGDTIIVPASMMLGAGDVLSAYTQDASTGGLVDYLVSAKITEFDA